MDVADNHVFISNVDTERFGVVTARVVGLNAASLLSVLDFCARHGVKFLIARCDMADLEAAQAMEREGFLLMDTLMVYAFDLARKVAPETKAGVVVRPIRADEEADMLIVAAKSFHNYVGHYHADPRLERRQCDEAYIDWARKTFASRTPDNFLVGEVQHNIVAFGVLRMNDQDEGEMFLGGIHPDFQGHGIYRSFLCEAREWCIRKGAKRMIISTQLKNLCVQKVLVKFGFEIFKGYYTYHKWFDL